MNVVVSGWDDLVDMAHFCSENAGCTQYSVKAVVYHVNPGVGSANLRCGHYVTYIKQEQQWYLANDSQVAPVLMSGMRGLPYLLALERDDARGEELAPVIRMELPQEIAVEIPAQNASPSFLEMSEADVMLVDAQEPEENIVAASSGCVDSAAAVDMEDRPEGRAAASSGCVDTAAAVDMQKGDADKGMPQHCGETAAAAVVPSRKREAAKAIAGQDLRLYFKRANLDAAPPAGSEPDRGGRDAGRTASRF